MIQLQCDGGSNSKFDTFPSILMFINYHFKFIKYRKSSNLFPLNIIGMPDEVASMARQ